MSRSLLVLFSLLLLTVSASAQTPERAAFTLSGGYLAADTYIDGEGVRDESGSTLTSSFLELGGEVHLVRQSNLTGSLGTTFRLVDLGFNDASEGGLRPQTLGFYGTVTNDLLDARAGVLLDIASDYEGSEAYVLANSDAQTAFLLGLSGQRAFDAARVFGGLDAFFTLPDRDALLIADAFGEAHVVGDG